MKRFTAQDKGNSSRRKNTVSRRFKKKTVLYGILHTINNVYLFAIIDTMTFWAIQVISGLPPTHFIDEKQPSKVKFQSALEYVGVDLELRSKKLPSILDPDKCIDVNCINLTCKLPPTEVKNFSARFSTFGIFFKNVLLCGVRNEWHLRYDS